MVSLPAHKLSAHSATNTAEPTLVAVPAAVSPPPPSHAHLRGSDAAPTPPERSPVVQLQGLAAARLNHQSGERRSSTGHVDTAATTTSIITKLLNPGGGDEKTVYMGSGAPHPADHANPNGYYERRDVISLDHGTLRTIEGRAGTIFRWLRAAPDAAQLLG